MKKTHPALRIQPVMIIASTMTVTLCLLVFLIIDVDLMPARPANKKRIHVTTPKVEKLPETNSMPERMHDLKLPVATRAACAHCGMIETISPVAEAKNTSIGIAAGAIIGGLLGSQNNSSRAYTLTTIAGAIGSRHTGHEIEQSPSVKKACRINVRMDNGSMQSFTQLDHHGWHAGDLVRIEKGALIRR